ncbi:hypothetical protein LAP8965_02175 [Lactiplantibacillus plantarum]|uniref:hypothetical protein n=1 Tax=Lactiplantibacillus plantarum TaxID=1590 RepID=UPI000D0BF23D|nr:hypothetical protein [Lactiplantibacillus plantarum]SPE08103.1 hypothetical protein LAP8963_02227 [Lactiplantibacillus plantarum]SPE12125.1 hypothetical protein LAP8964_02039 [Lactiplantibacillus plantarum]SPH06844.1 hypothetical protein LAP8965_02175 [Lactiplantibacillus plantarum]SPH09992.1 hypothetical protein LAP8966_02182 [Lactiplantibacillus plantarum]
MAKTLSFTDTSPQTVKIGDTTTSFTLICGNDNVATDLTNATSITVKLGNASGYLKSATVDPTSLTDPATGQVTVTFNADLMTSLTAGSYAIEVWVVDSTGTSIYPSDGSTGFNIDNNIQSANGATITTITFDDFVKAMNKAASTIAKGDKGDKGDTGPQGAMTTQDIQNVVTSMLSYNSLANGTDLFTLINNTGYTTHYCISTNSDASTLINCPVNTVFALDVKTSSPANQSISSTGNPVWVYNMLELHPYNSNDIWTGAISSDAQGNITATPWKKLATV